MLLVLIVTATKSTLQQQVFDGTFLPIWCIIKWPRLSHVTHVCRHDLPANGITVNGRRLVRLVVCFLSVHTDPPFATPLSQPAIVSCTVVLSSLCQTLFLLLFPRCIGRIYYLTLRPLTIILILKHAWTVYHPVLPMCLSARWITWPVWFLPFPVLLMGNMLLSLDMWHRISMSVKMLYLTALPLVYCNCAHTLDSVLKQVSLSDRHQPSTMLASSSHPGPAPGTGASEAVHSKLVDCLWIGSWLTVVAPCYPCMSLTSHLSQRPSFFRPLSIIVWFIYSHTCWWSYICASSTVPISAVASTAIMHPVVVPRSRARLFCVTITPLLRKRIVSCYFLSDGYHLDSALCALYATYTADGQIMQHFAWQTIPFILEFDRFPRHRFRWWVASTVCSKNSRLHREVDTFIQK